MRHVLRTLAREKTFTAFAVLTLALGIGVVTAIFSIVDGVLLRPLAYKDPGRLYAGSESARALAHANRTIPVNASHFRSWQEQCRSCETEALLNPATFNLTGGGDPDVPEFLPAPEERASMPAFLPRLLDQARPLFGGELELEQ